MTEVRKYEKKPIGVCICVHRYMCYLLLILCLCSRGRKHHQEVKRDFSSLPVPNPLSCWINQELLISIVICIDSEELKAFKRKEGAFIEGLLCAFS